MSNSQLFALKLWILGCAMLVMISTTHSWFGLFYLLMAFILFGFSGYYEGVEMRERRRVAEREFQLMQHKMDKDRQKRREDIAKANETVKKVDKVEFKNHD